MNRDDNDVFEPPVQLRSPPGDGVTTDGTAAALTPDTDPQAGPTSEWTASGVIAALEPLTTSERCERLRATLRSRIDAVTVVFDQPHDPHNGSAVLRSCDAFGVQRVHVVRGHEAFAASRVVAKGSQRWVDIIEHQRPESCIELLKKSGHHLLVTHPEGTLVPSDLASLPKVALILGNERDGVSPELTRAADESIKIPMRGFVESLNVSVSAAILLHAACLGRVGDLSETRAKNVYARWLRNSVPRADEVLRALNPC